MMREETIIAVTKALSEACVEVNQAAAAPASERYKQAKKLVELLVSALNVAEQDSE